MIDGMPWWAIAGLVVMVVAYALLWVDELRRK